MLPLKPFYFIRHGQTDWNVNKIVMGQQEIPLNDVGIKQAFDAIEILKKVSIGSICSSPLKRAYQTAKIIQEVVQLPLELYEGLMEHSWGKYEGQGSEKIIMYENLSEDIELNSGAETMHRFGNRILKTMEAILNQSILLPPLIVSHGGIFTGLVNELGINWGSAENCVPYFFKPSDYKNNSWTIYIVGEDKKYE